MRMLIGNSGLRAGDLDGRMRQYAEVLLTLNGGQSCIDLFVRDNPVLKAKDDFGDPMDCIMSVVSLLRYLDFADILT